MTTHTEDAQELLKAIENFSDEAIDKAFKRMVLQYIVLIPEQLEQIRRAIDKSTSAHSHPGIVPGPTP